ncbi:PAS domain S-box-containing protein [Caldalkalibacillus uzonensis]|uniref:histidine kinase n=1 Tax=Caldalkalibacillus uzonensis TaxID=353224 RepID=A0ABU0CVX0_9BACI|nr:PAS domain-containing sensor histidine kinase [Caldalkalibacillus uzonensis]MDQ0340570.1 PAS domain S-box-containing protein [Caldalkalibacillus uzonensis]
MDLTALYNRLVSPLRKSIRLKYVVLFAITFIIPTLIIYQLIVGYAKQTIEQDIINTNVVTTDGMVKRLNNELTDVVLQLRLIVGNVEDHQLDVERIFHRSKLAISQSSIIHSIYLLNEDQLILFEAPFAPDIEPVYYDYPYFSQVYWSRNYAVSDFVTNPRGEGVVTVAIPVLSDRQQFKGVLIAELSNDYLSEVLKSFSVTNGHFSFLIDSQGRVIASTNEREIGVDLSAEAVFGHLDHDLYGVLKDHYRDEKSIIAYQTLRDGWSLVFGVPEYIAYEPIQKLSSVLTISFASILALSLLFIWTGMRNIVYPIVRLTNYAKRYREQIYYEPEENIYKYPDDELGELWKTIISVGNSNYQKQKMLEEKERYLQDVLEGIPYGIITINKEAKISYVNKQFENMVGYCRKDMIGKPLSQLPIKQDDDFLLLDALSSESSQGESESYIINSEGQKLIVKICTARFYNEQQEVIGSIAVLQDISQMKLLESRLKQNDKLALIGQITTGIAHEIKNPLAILSGSTELLLESAEEAACTEEVKELSLDIYQVVQRMKDTVNNFLSFAKINKRNKELIDIKDVMEEVLHLVRLKLRECRVIVDRHYAHPFKLIGQRDQLIQAFLNLVLNAIEAMPDGGTLTVSIGTEGVGDHSKEKVVTITDTGAGIPEKDLEWLFDPFFSTKESGNGLGLTIARDIISEHNGELTIDSLVGEGTKVQCRFAQDRVREELI